MTRRFALYPVALAALLPLTACSTSAHVVKQGAPEALQDERRFNLMPVAFESLQVGKGSEAAYLSRKDEDQKANWEGDKLAIGSEFAKHLREEAMKKGIQVSPRESGASYFIRPTVHFIEPGFFAGPAFHHSEVVMSIEIVGKDGQVLDELRIEHTTMASMAKASVRDRLEYDGASLGEAVAEYLDQRVND